MLGLKLNHVIKRGPWWCHIESEILVNICSGNGFVQLFMVLNMFNSINSIPIFLKQPWNYQTKFHESHDMANQYPDRKPFKSTDRCLIDVHQRAFAIWVPTLTHLLLDKMATISQTTFSNAFSWMKKFDFLLKCHWSLFLWVQLTITQHWFR